MRVRDLPPEAARLWKTLYQDEDSELHDLRFEGTITKRLFAEILVGCLYRNQERAERFIKHDRRNHRRLLNKAGMRYFEKRAADPIPAVAQIGRHNLELQDAARQHHDQVAAWAKAESRFLNPIVCLYALFKYVVKPRRAEDPVDGGLLPAEGIEHHMRTTIPDMLNRAGLRPLRATAWTPEIVDRQFRRYGGKRAADLAAFYLLSIDDRLKDRRPAPPSGFPQLGAPDPDLSALMIGRALFGLPTARPAPGKPSRGGQRIANSARGLSG